jgi:hypothetical protein
MTLYAMGGGGQHVIPITHEGRYSVSDVPPGEYLVTIETVRPQWTPPAAVGPPRGDAPPDWEKKSKQFTVKPETGSDFDLPVVYTDRVKSILRLTVTEGVNEQKDFPLS